MNDVTFDSVKKCLIIKLGGYLSDQEIKSVVDKILSTLKTMKPGFFVITDISEFMPSSENGVLQMKRVQEILYKSGVKRVFRVVGNIVSKMQFDRVQKEANADYETIEVKTIEDALKMI
jgi:hypothetical protein